MFDYQSTFFLFCRFVLGGFASLSLWFENLNGMTTLATVPLDMAIDEDCDDDCDDASAASCCSFFHLQ